MSSRRFTQILRMKDRQVHARPPALRIPIVSTVLHCVSMTTIVFLRSDFGYAYLGPKSIFLAFIYALILFAVYAWNEPEVWQIYWAFCGFGIAAALLYLTHLFTAITREIYRVGKHDHSSGISHMLRAIGAKRWAKPHMHIWVEPVIVILIAILLRTVWSETKLSGWLMLVAPSLAVKEALNLWFQLRQKKRHHDSQDDAIDIFDEDPRMQEAEAPKAVGRERVKRPRTNKTSAEDDLKERHFAQILRLMPPYTLDAAEQNYRQLIKEVHPDPNEQNSHNNALAAQLNDAIAHFRAKFT